MSIAKNSQEKFIETAKKIYINLTFEEKNTLKYGDLIEMTMKEIYQKCSKSQKGQGYGYFKEYYLNHPYLDNSNFKLERSERLDIADIKELLDYDTRKEAMQKALDGYYRYYWFNQDVIYENTASAKRQILILESDEVSIKEAYQVICKSFFELFESAYLGFGGIIIIFNDNEKDRLKYSEIFINSLPEKSEKDRHYRHLS